MLLFTVALLGLPGSSAANWSPAGDEALRAELQNLQEVRDRLDQRRAVQRTLQGEARALAAEIEALRARYAQMSADLQSQRQQALVLEQRLDRLVPRLLARAAEVRERRVRTALALAEMASKARHVEVDSTVRARMLAISPLMLKRLRSVESGLGSLRGLPERTIERHAEIARRVSELTTAQQELPGTLEQKQRVRQIAVAQLREVNADIRLLSDEETRLARRLVHAEAAVAARAEPQAHQHALPDPVGAPAARAREASVAKSSIAGGTRLARVAQAEYRSASEVLAAAPMAEEAVDLADETRWPALSSRAEPLAEARAAEIPQVGRSAPEEAVSRTARLNVVFTPDADRSDVGTAATRGGRATPPLLPVPEELRKRALAARDHPEMTVAAAPGQRIAAPVDGEVVFAERFKSYGLLLIIEHEREYHTLLWGFARLDVRLGERVQVGQIVGIMDTRGDGPPVLHVERRRNGRPINLAASNSGIQG